MFAPQSTIKGFFDRALKLYVSSKNISLNWKTKLNASGTSNLYDKNFIDFVV